jgi:DNA mismatch repair protein MutH
MGAMAKSKSAPKVTEKDVLTSAAVAIGSTLGSLAKRVGLTTPAKKKAKKKVAAKVTKTVAAAKKLPAKKVMVKKPAAKKKSAKK